MITHYDVLKVTTNASLTVITEAYNALCKKYNPDNYQDEIKRAKAESVIKRLNESFEILSNEKKRADYDLKLKFIEDTNVILNDEKISPEIKQTDTNEGVLKQINFGKIKDDISQSVENVKTEIQHSIDENITSKVDLNKVKGSIAQSVENTKTLAEKIEHSVHEKIGKIDFDAIKSEIKEKIHTLDSNAEKKSKNDSEIGDDFYHKIIADTENIYVQNVSNLNQNPVGKIQKSKISVIVITSAVLLLYFFWNFDVVKNDLEVSLKLAATPFYSEDKRLRMWFRHEYFEFEKPNSTTVIKYKILDKDHICVTTKYVTYLASAKIYDLANGGFYGKDGLLVNKGRIPNGAFSRGYAILGKYQNEESCVKH